MEVEMPMSDAELQARAIIAAALMQSHVVDLSGVSFHTPPAEGALPPAVLKLRIAVDVVCAAIMK
jgi:hypothetical protein